MGGRASQKPHLQPRHHIATPVNRVHAVATSSPDLSTPPGAAAKVEDRDALDAQSCPKRANAGGRSG